MQEIISIENQNNISVKGATKVISSTPSQAIIQTPMGLIVFTGTSIEVKKLDIENTEVILSGTFNNIKFARKADKQPFLKRIFK